MTKNIDDRCRLVLIPPDGLFGADLADPLKAALAAGDVASVIFPVYGQDEAAYQRHLQSAVPVAQESGAAAIAVNDTRTFGRSGADGLHVDTGLGDIADTVEKSQGRFIVGAGGVKTRHAALDVGELRPDYIFFGRFGQDTHPAPYRKNVALAEWWAAIVEIPCILMGGADLDSLPEAAATGAEFVALSCAVFSGDADPAYAVARANAILEDHSPVVET
jgi:thiamine-phosphate pyrophosphorylase